MLFFNKQYRIESGIFSRLTKKFKAAQVASVRKAGNTEIYTLDNSWRISFDVLTKVLTVVDINEKQEIISLDCKFGGDYVAAELQNARFYAFSNLLNVARKRIDRDEKSAQKREAFGKAQARAAQALELKSKEEQASQALENARKKLR